ncbi:CDP-alcohol phosphatidyltransferase family protein [Rhodoligotrophos defluvii]|uniref:CDP-alcohol phosphatidyltransferase family protein n=1 Tax=Rhodoligotrophos defluvii TaxID=2561934 RepID=UPI0010C95D93|nr:CDP-alcohol phosphatidyltransferase family protein [Rhodoligotrophos defluvii]
MSVSASVPAQNQGNTVSSSAHSRDAVAKASDSARSAAGPVLCLLGASDVALFGLTPAARLIRQFGRAGITRVITADDLATHSGPVIAVRADAAIDQPLVQYLAEHPDFILTQDPERMRPLAVHLTHGDAAAVEQALESTSEPAASPTGIRRGAPADLDVTFWSALRKREVPYALTVSRSNARAVEWRMFMGTYKGATDIVTKHLWPVPAFWVTRWIAPLGVTPNMITTLGAAMVVAAFFLFLEGHFALGLAAAWMMTFLDTVDGKLARVTLTSSKWGDIFDHGIDLVHPPFWYIAWGLGLGAAGLPLADGVLLWTLVLIFGGYVLQRIMEGIAIKALGLEIHIWRPIDTLFRQVTARRNPNLVILTASVLVGRPDLGLLAVAAWTIICLVLHGIQLAQALLAARRDGPLVSWMRKPVTSP